MLSTYTLKCLATLQAIHFTCPSFGRTTGPRSLASPTFLDLGGEEGGGGGDGDRGAGGGDGRSWRQSNERKGRRGRCPGWGRGQGPRRLHREEGIHAGSLAVESHLMPDGVYGEVGVWCKEDGRGELTTGAGTYEALEIMDLVKRTIC